MHVRGRGKRGTLMARADGVAEGIGARGETDAGIVEVRALIAGLLERIREIGQRRALLVARRLEPGVLSPLALCEARDLLLVLLDAAGDVGAVALGVGKALVEAGNRGLLGREELF